MQKKRVFVTVGTTQFQKLIDTITTTEVLNRLATKGYNQLVIQYGTGTFNNTNHSGLKILDAPYYDNFQEEINKSHLVISHAGAGSCLETLKLHKPLIVVINEDLMDNHQTELAEELAAHNHLYYCTCSMLYETLQKPLDSFTPYPQAKPGLFQDYLNKSMGFDK